MAFLDKLKFWKKHEEPILERPSSESDFGTVPGSDDTALGASGDDLGSPMSEDFGAAGADMGMDHVSPNVPDKPAVGLPGSTGIAPEPIPSVGTNRDIELILAKLDFIKAKVDSMDARLMHIEKLAEE